MIQFVLGADGEAVPAAGAHGGIDILSVRTFGLDADEKILLATDGTGDGAEPLLYDLRSVHDLSSMK